MEKFSTACPAIFQFSPSLFFPMHHNRLLGSEARFHICVHHYRSFDLFCSVAKIATPMDGMFYSGGGVFLDCALAPSRLSLGGRSRLCLTTNLASVGKDAIFQGSKVSDSFDTQFDTGKITIVFYSGEVAATNQSEHNVEIISEFHSSVCPKLILAVCLFSRGKGSGRSSFDMQF